MTSYIYYLLGYPDTEVEKADERQKHLKHLVLKQIRNSNIKLKKVNCCSEGPSHPGSCVYLGTIAERLAKSKYRHLSVIV